MSHYTIHGPHDPSTLRGGMKKDEYPTLSEALEAAYRFLPLTPGHLENREKDPKKKPRWLPSGGLWVTVQEWGEEHEPLRQWLISGRMP